MKRTMRVLAGSLLIALSPLANAQSDPIDAQVNILEATAKNRGQALVAGKIASNFGNLAGSDKNALTLVNALRNGTNATLTYTTPATTPGGTPTTTTTTYDPPTGKMGWGNVKISLALAQDALARAGITNPTAEQLQAALNGGTVTVTNADGTTTATTLKGVLQMRADGMGWGEIAKAGGTKVGPVVSQLKMANTKVAALPAEPSKSTTAAGSSPTSKSKGMTTAAGAGDAAPKEKSKGVVSGTGSTPASGKAPKGITTAGGVSAASTSRGVVTAEGALSAHQPKGNAYGRGVVTGAGGSATNVAATGGGKPTTGGGAGLVTGGGGGASGVSTGHGNSGGNGKGNAGGSGNGKGKGG